MRIDYQKFMENYLLIRNKQGKVCKFILNKPQKRLHDIIMKQLEEDKPVRIVILKARQMGFSTYIEALLFSFTVLNKGVKTGIIAHTEKASKNIFAMTKRFFRNLLPALKPEIEASNAKELIFNNKEGTGLDSEIDIMTATDEGVGRSATYRALHLSEFDFWKCDIDDVYTALSQCIPYLKETMMFIESTANGYRQLRDMFYDENNGFIKFFAAWYELEEYQLPYHNEPLTLEELEIKAKFNLTNEQIMWRRYALHALCKGNIDKFKQEYPSTPEEAFIATGGNFFEIKQVIKRLEDNIQPLKIGDMEYLTQYSKEKERMIINLESIKFNNNVNGNLKIYEMPDSTRTYCIGGDPAGEGSDFYIANVVDSISGKQVAIFENKQMGEDKFGEMMYCLGKFYNWALIGIETNISSYATKILDPEHLDYPNLYIRETEDDYTGRLLRKYGFRTTSFNRMNTLIALQNIVRDEIELINDKETLLEMTTFIKNQNGKPEAMPNKHDDRIMSLAIAHALRESGQVRKMINNVEEESGSWLKKLLEKAVREKEEAEEDEFNFY